MADDKKTLRCSFCGKHEQQVHRMIQGPGVRICDECVELCVSILNDGYEDRGSSLEETFSVRGKVKRLELSGVGELTGEAANRAIDVLLDQAVLQSADASSRRQTLTVTLDSGLMLQLGVSGDTLCGCGGWSCPEFFEAFEAAL